MEFVKLLKAGSIISGINWAIYLIHEWVNFAKNNPPDALAEGGNSKLANKLCSTTLSPLISPG